MRGSHSAPAAYRILLLAILLLAWALLLVRLNDIPPGFQHDQMFDARDALDVLAGRGQFYFPANFGREPLFMYTAASVLAVLRDQVVWGLRFTSVAWATLGLAATAALARRYLAWPAALVAPAAMAGSFWFLFAGRLGLEPIPLLCLGMAALFFLDRGLARAVQGGPRALGDFAVAGLCAAAGVYTYLAGRALFLLFPLLLLYELLVAPPWRRSEEARRDYRVYRGLLLSFALMLAAGAPLLIYVSAHPELADRRVGEVGAGLAAALRGDLSGVLSTTWDTVLAVLWRGSTALPYQYSLPGRPALQPAWAALFLAGLGVTLARALGLAGATRGPGALPARRHEVVLLLSLLLALAPDFLSGADALYMRGIMALPIIFIVAARGLWWAAQRLVRLLARLGRPARWAFPVLAALLLGWLVAESCQAYFVRWAEAEQTQRIYNGDLRAAAAYLDAHPPVGQAYAGTDRLMDLDEQTYQLYGPQHAALRWFQLPGSVPLPGQGDASYILTGSGAEDVADLAILGPAQRHAFTVPAARGNFDLLRGFRLSAADIEQALAAQGVDSLAEPPTYGGILRALAAGVQDHGSYVDFLVRWQVLAPWPRPGPPPTLSVSLVDADGYRWAQSDRPTTLPYETWRPGETYLELVRVPVPGDLPPGDYGARLLVYSDPARPLSVERRGAQAAVASTVATMAAAGVRADRGSPPAPPLPMPSTSETALRPVGAWEGPRTLFAGVPATWHVDWQPAEDLATRSLGFRVRGLAPDGKTLWDEPASPAQPLPAQWPAGQTYRLAHHFSPRLPEPGTTPASIEICATREGQVLGCGEMGGWQVVDRPPLFALEQPPARASGADWNGQLALAGYDLQQTGQAVQLTLYWQVRRAPETDLQRFVHAVGPADQILAQADGVPDHGGVPMPSWRPGEYVVDRIALDIPPGHEVSTLYVGFYDPETGERVPVRLASGEAPADRKLAIKP